MMMNSGEPMNASLLALPVTWLVMAVALRMMISTMETMIAGAAMSFSSVSVIANALRLRRVKL